MHLSAQQTTQLTEESLRSFVALSIPEGPYLDYKQALSGQSEREAKREFLKDVSGFANAAGGTLILGVREPSPGLSADDQIRGIDNGVALAHNLERVASASLDPRIPGLRVVAVLLASGKACIVVHVPASRSRPHMVTHDGHRAFYARHSESIQPMSTHEIREAVLVSSSAEMRARQQIAESVAETRKSAAEPCLFIQAVPLIAPEPAWDVFGKPMEEALRTGTRKGAFNYIDLVTGIAPLPTIDGTLVCNSREDPDWVLEAHRNGYVSLRFRLQEHNTGSDQFFVIHSGTCEVFRAFCRLLSDLVAVSGTDVPFAIAASCLNAEGLRIWTESKTTRFSKPYAKREITWPLHLRDTGADARPIADQMATELFNGFGFKEVVK